MDASFEDFEESFEVNTSVEEDYFETQRLAKTRSSTPVKPTSKPPVQTQGNKGATLRAVAGALGEQPVKEQPKPTDRVAQARVWLRKAKTHLGESRNLRSDLKAGITLAVDELFRILKEEAAEGKSGIVRKSEGAVTEQKRDPNAANRDGGEREGHIMATMEENSRLLRENIAKMEDLKSSLELQRKTWERAPTYSEAVAGKAVPKNGALHSVVVTSKDETETGEEVLEKVRKVLDAKEGWVKVERVRKAKNQKVIMSFVNTEERDKARRRMEQDSAHLNVEEVKNRDPLLILRDVLKTHSDEDVMRALRNQNRGVFHGLDAGEDRVEVKYKRRTKNPLTCHIVLSVAPILWSRATQKGRLRIDLQQVRVEDQSPLVQCTRCLGYGHGRRFCKEPADLCSHCGGPHLRAECTARLAGEGPACRNCVTAKHSKTDHNAFSKDCPVKRKWDILARATVAYC